MRYHGSEFHLLHFDPTDPHANGEIHRANVIVISILGFFLLGIFLAMLLPSPKTAVARGSRTPVANSRSEVLKK